MTGEWRDLEWIFTVDAIMVRLADDLEIQTASHGRNLTFDRAHFDSSADFLEHFPYFHRENFSENQFRFAFTRTRR